MTEKAEWEVVDDTGQQQGQQARQSAESMAKGLLGPWWRWKVAGLATAAAVMVALFIAFAGVLALFVIAATIVSLMIGKAAQWLRGSKGSGSSTHVRRNPYDDRYR